jgi:hypothetical protein
MKKKNYLIVLFCLALTDVPALASPNYLCPEPNLVAAETLKALRQGENNVIIETNYGTLIAIIKNTKTIKTELENNTIPEFHHAAILFQNIKMVPYDLECAYEFPELTFYMHDTRLFIGASDYYWYARGQGQQGPYAWCNGKGNGVKSCSFIDKPTIQKNPAY